MASCSAAMACSRGATRSARAYLNTITIIDQLGQFIERHASQPDIQPLRWGEGEVACRAREDCRRGDAVPARGRLAQAAMDRQLHRFATQVLDFVNSENAEKLAHLGTSCPDHFIRTKIRPMFLKWDPATRSEGDSGADRKLA